MKVRNFIVSVAILLSLNILSRPNAYASQEAIKSVRLPQSLILSGLNGSSKIEGADLKGKVIVFQFFASWCVGCEKVMSEMINFKKIRPDIVYVPVSVDENIETAKSFFNGKPVEVKAIESRAFLDQDAALAMALNVVGVPTIIIADKDGNVLVNASGHPTAQTWADFGKLVDTALRTK